MYTHNIFLDVHVHVRVYDCIPYTSTCTCIIAQCIVSYPSISDNITNDSSIYISCTKLCW